MAEWGLASAMLCEPFPTRIRDPDPPHFDFASAGIHGLQLHRRLSGFNQVSEELRRDAVRPHEPFLTSFPRCGERSKGAATMVRSDWHL
jgi:hypothetical protein